MKEYDETNVRVEVIILVIAVLLAAAAIIGFGSVEEIIQGQLS